MPKENSAMKPDWKISSGKTIGSPAENQSADDDLNEHFILGFLSEKQNRSLLINPNSAIEKASISLMIDFHLRSSTLESLSRACLGNLSRTGFGSI